MLTKLSQWVSILFCSLPHGFLFKSHEITWSIKPRRCSLMYMSIRTLDYVIFSHQANLSKTTKHWDGFVSHCTIYADLACQEIQNAPKQYSTWNLVATIIILVSATIDKWEYDLKKSWVITYPNIKKLTVQWSTHIVSQPVPPSIIERVHHATTIENLQGVVGNTTVYGPHSPMLLPFWGQSMEKMTK